MKNIESLRNIAEYLNFKDIVSQINAIELRSKQENAFMILPLVGEFSSGKTSLINALTDSKNLETAIKPTTSTIYEIHFGCDSCHAQLINENDELQDINDIAELKNEELANAKIVTVYDTSNQVPSSTILADTPGLSSQDPKHKQNLINFLPNADGILLVVDINQQITKSLTDFIETIKLSNRPYYLVLTKSDTKSAVEITDVKKYISKNCQIPLEQIVVTSAHSNSLDELHALFNDIQKNKNDIIRKADEQRLKAIAKILSDNIKELLNSSSSEKELNNAINNKQHELDKINQSIDRLIHSISDDIEEKGRNTSRKFEDIIYNKLSSIVSNKSNNYDDEVISAINSIASLLMNEYKNDITSLLQSKAKSHKNSENDLSLTSLEYLDLSNIQMSGLSYNIDLNSMGHEYDNMIKTGLFVTAAIGAVALAPVAAAAGTAAAGTAAAGTAAAAGSAAAGTAAASITIATASKTIDIIDTASDIGSIIYNHKTRKKVEQITDFLSKTGKEYTKIKNNNNNGIINNLISSVTDKTISKPKRNKAIRDFINDSLVPEFKYSLNIISKTITNSIHSKLNEEASALINQKTEALNMLKSEMKDKKEQFKQRTEQLREYQKLLSNI